MTLPARNGAAGQPHFGGMPSLEHEVADFKRDVIERSSASPVLVFFWTPWHEPCRTLRSTLEPVLERHRGHLHLATVNVEMHRQLADELKVPGIPVTRLYIGGQALGEFSGVLPESAVEAWLDAALRHAQVPPVTGTAGLAPGGKAPGKTA